MGWLQDIFISMASLIPPDSVKWWAVLLWSVCVFASLSLQKVRQQASRTGRRSDFSQLVHHILQSTVNSSLWATYQGHGVHPLHLDPFLVKCIHKYGAIWSLPYLDRVVQCLTDLPELISPLWKIHFLANPQLYIVIPLNQWYNL